MASSDAKDADLGGAILGGTIGAAVGGPFAAGVGAVIGAALLGRPSRRVVFERALREELRKHRVELVSAHPGRDAQGPIWIVLASRGSKRRKVHASVGDGDDMFAPTTSTDIATRVSHYFDSAGG